MLAFLKRFFAVVDGNKTAIGGIILMCSNFLQQVIVPLWQLSEQANLIMLRVYTSLDWVGMFVVTGGLIHKGVKLFQETNENKAEASQ